MTGGANSAVPARFRVLVLCTGNSARSQIAEALLATHGAGRIEAASGGSRPAARVNPFAVGVLQSHGIAWSGREPTHVGAYDGQHFDLVITVCDNARDACPIFPTASAQVHWGLPDPADHTEAAAARAAFEQAYASIGARVQALLALPLETMTPDAIGEAARHIHERFP